MRRFGAMAPLLIIGAEVSQFGAAMTLWLQARSGLVHSSTLTLAGVTTSVLLTAAGGAAWRDRRLGASFCLAVLAPCDYCWLGGRQLVAESWLFPWGCGLALLGLLGVFIACSSGPYPLDAGYELKR